MRSRSIHKTLPHTQPVRHAPSDAVMELKAPPVAESRTRLLAAASYFFLTGSYHGVGIAEICAAASVQKGTFYHFFPSKTDLLLAVIERRVQEIEETITKIAAGKVPAARKIVQVFTLTQPASDPTAETARDTPPPGYFLGNIILELASSNPPVQAAAKTAFNRWIKAIEQIIAQLVAEEKLHNLDTADAAEAVLGLVQGGAVMASAYNEPRKMRAFGTLALSLLRSSGSPP